MMVQDLVLLMMLIRASPAGSLDSHYEGRREFVRGMTTCSTQADPISFTVGHDGGVRGDVATSEGPLRFYGTVGATGHLLATSGSAAGAEFVSLEGVFKDDRFEGFIQSKSCRYKIALTRR
jgi:hypothetical protein